MSKEDDCHADLELKAVGPDRNVYIGEFIEKRISAVGLFSEDNLDEECRPRGGLIFGVLDEDGNEDNSFVVVPTLRDDIKRTSFPTKFTVPAESKKDGVVHGKERAVFVRDSKFEVVGWNCIKDPDEKGGACSILKNAIVFVKRN